MASRTILTALVAAFVAAFVAGVAGAGAGSPKPPVITGLNPESGVIGSTLTIKGQRLSTAVDVRFVGGDVHPADFTVVSSGIRVVVPPGAQTGPVEVTTPDDTVDSPEDFQLAPTIDSIDPTEGAAGYTLTVTGSGLTNPTTVKIGGTAADDPAASDDGTILTAVVPDPPPSGTVSVTTPVGTAKSDQTFTGVPAPKVTRFNPASGAAGTVVTIHGRHLNFVTQVLFAGDAVSAPFTIVSKRKILATVTPEASSGPIQLTSLGGTATSSDAFSVPLSIASFSPAAGLAGDEITITGTGFGSATEVDFGGVPAFFSVSSSTSIEANVPDGAPEGPITVTEYFGQTATSAQSFEYTQLDGFSPDVGVPGSHVVITGRHLENVIRVLFGPLGHRELSPSFTVSADGTQIDAIVPSNPAPQDGPITITNTVGAGEVTSDADFHVIRVTDVTPGLAPVGAPLSISGSYLQSTTALVVDGVRTTDFTVDPSGTLITTTIPGRADGTRSVTVETPSGVVGAIGPAILVTLDDFTPKFGPPLTRITVTGTGFRAATVFNVGDPPVAPPTNLTINDDGTSASFNVPVVQGPVIVGNQYGVARSADSFSLFGISAVLSSLLVKPGDVVTIQQWGLNDATAVTFNGVPGAFQFDASQPSVMYATVPQGMTTGPLVVSTPRGDAPGPIFYATHMDGYTPTSGGVGTQVVISGAGFHEVTVTGVTIGGGSVPFTVDSDTQITATVTAAARTGAVLLATNHGTPSSNGSFTVTSG